MPFVKTFILAVIATGTIVNLTDNLWLSEPSEADDSLGLSLPEILAAVLFGLLIFFAVVTLRLPGVQTANPEEATPLLIL